MTRYVLSTLALCLLSVVLLRAGLTRALVHDLLVLLDGDSLLQSEAGVGTRVEFSVPVVPA